MSYGFRALRTGLRVVQKPRNSFLYMKCLPTGIQIRNKADKFVRPITTTKKFQQKSKSLRREEETDSDSDSDDEKHYSKERGESEFWKTKMRTLHRILDINKDGVVSFDDFKLLTEKFTDLGHLTQEHHDEFQEKIKEAWEIQRGTIDPYNLVTTDQFLEDMHHIMNDKSLRKKVHSFLPFFFKAVDQDHDGEITIDEYKIFFECLGLTEADAICSFRTIDDDNDGKLGLREFVKLGREYLLSEDPRAPSRVSLGNEDIVPAFIWTGSERQDSPHVVDDQIQSRIFESYMKKILSDKQPLLVVFLEEELSPDDFFWRNDNDESGYYPFLENLMQKDSLKYFKEIESPYQVIANVSKNRYDWKEWTPKTKWTTILNAEKTAFLVRFDKINSGRLEILKERDRLMKSFHENLKKSGLDWICIYTGQKAPENGLSTFKSLSTWQVDEEPLENPTKILSLYQDEHTGLALFIRGVVQVFLPSARRNTVINLENHWGASEKRVKNKNRFIVQFPNHTLTFCIRKVTSGWSIDKMRITNENGFTLNLTAKSRNVDPGNKCREQKYEFQSVQKPLVKVKISKYKFIRLPLHEEACSSPFSLHVVSSFMFLSIVTVALFWNSFLKTQTFTKKHKILRISVESLKLAN
ncbi:hypothetical protein RUM44_013600 [Polyplax serrata]|uniref:EF-hand domain-containing protein n=1 Tax=Polyplax serrata TaxID=468196 RepID=A0ABR1BEL5_POLSC